MKASEALLRAIEANGGEVVHYQLARWTCQLFDAGLLETVWKDEKGYKTPYHKLTEKAVKLLEGKG